MTDSPTDKPVPAAHTEPRWWDTVPSDIRRRLEGVPVVASGAATGPSFMVAEVERFDPPITRSEGIAWLRRRDSILRRCHLEFEDGTVIFFERGGTFFRCRSIEEHGRPEPGIIVKHESPD